MTSLINLSVLLADAAPAPATTQQQVPLWTNLPFFILIGVMFYFVFVRPQQKRAKQQAEMLKAIKPGDKVITTGGVVGVVVTVKEKTISIRSADSKMEITKGAVAE